jgi:hypothetical protein
VSLWRQCIRGLRVLGNRKAADQEIADEVGHYLEKATAPLVSKGLSPDEARRAVTAPRSRRASGFGPASKDASRCCFAAVG